MSKKASEYLRWEEAGVGWAASLVCVLMFTYFASASGARWAWVCVQGVPGRPTWLVVCVVGDGSLSLVYVWVKWLLIFLSERERMDI